MGDGRMSALPAWRHCAPSACLFPTQVWNVGEQEGESGSPDPDPLSEAGPGLGLEDVTESLMDRTPHLEGLLQCRFQGYIATKYRAWWLS